MPNFDQNSQFSQNFEHFFFHLFIICGNSYTKFQLYWSSYLKPYFAVHICGTTPERQGRNRHIFLRGQCQFYVIFPDFFPGVKCYIPVENSNFGRPKTNFRRFQKWKENKKMVLTFFYNFSYFNFQFSTFPFTIFLLFLSILTPFSFLLASFFPDTSAQIFQVKSLWGGHSAPLPPACYAIGRKAYEYPSLKPMQ